MSSSPNKPLHIDIQNLTFGYAGREPVLRNLNMQLTDGARCLLIGANGAGKSTLLRILSGRHLTKPDEAVQVLGRSAFHDTRLNFERSYLDTDWGMRTVAFAGYGCPLQADIPVYGMMVSEFFLSEIAVCCMTVSFAMFIASIRLNFRRNIRNDATNY